MFLGEVIRKLRSEGYPVTTAKIRHARETGCLRPKPREVPIGLGVYAYTKRHLAQLREYLETVRPGPRPRKPRPPGNFDPGLAERQEALDAAIRQIEEANVCERSYHEEVD